MNQPSIKDFTDLVVYQKAYEKSLEIHRETGKYPEHEQYELGRQMRRASKGICANIAEGFGKQNVSKPEFKRFLLMARRRLPSSTYRAGEGLHAEIVSGKSMVDRCPALLAIPDEGTAKCRRSRAAVFSSGGVGLDSQGQIFRKPQG